MKRITIKVVPRSSRNEIIGPMSDGTLKVALTAAPVDGAANDALIELLSKEWNVHKSQITIVRGEKSKKKIIGIKN